MTAMTETEKQEYLADLHVGVLSLNDNSNGPLTAPIWYDYEPGGELWFITGPNSLKGKLLEVGVRLSYLGETGGQQYTENSNGSGGVLVRVKPERWLAVDYGKG